MSSLPTEKIGLQIKFSKKTIGNKGLSGVKKRKSCILTTIELLYSNRSSAVQTMLGTARPTTLFCTSACYDVTNTL